MVLWIIMEIYFFFKKYYRAMWRHLALFLSAKWMSANIASIAALFIMLPVFLLIHIYIDIGFWYWIALFLAVNLKLVLNAIDGIIAEDQNDFSQVGRYLNVWTDIIPDIFIIYLLFSKIWTPQSITITLCAIIALYVMGEFLYIYMRKKQNLFFGKEMRVVFYLIIFALYITWHDMLVGVYTYFIFFVIHNVRFFSK